jgi:serine/threonine protein kinase
MVAAHLKPGLSSMRFNDLKAALQPSLDSDLSKIYAEFVRESGTGDLVRFLGYLRDRELVSADVLDGLLNEGTLNPGAVEDLARRNTPGPSGRREGGARGAVATPRPEPEAPPVEAADAYSAPDDGGAAESSASDAEALPADQAVADGADGAAVAADEGSAGEAAPSSEGGEDTEDGEDAVTVDTSGSDDAAPSEAEGAADVAGEGAAVTFAPADDAPADDAAADDAPADDAAASGDEASRARAERDAAANAEDGNERPKRRSESRTGARTGGRRRTGGDPAEGASDRAGTGARRRAGERGAAGQTSARDRLKKTMFALRHDAETAAQDTSELLRRDYKFVGKVGEGAMGRVLKARDNDLLRLVAYKEMSEEIAANAQLASKFFGEAQITAQLDHPNIVPVYQMEQSADGMLAYTMKLIKGKTVEDYIEEVKEAYGKDKKNLPAECSLEKRLELFLRCCDAMYYAHRRGIVHRDLKPENIMIGHYGEVYVMDWGIAKVVRDSDIVTEEPVELLYNPEEDPELIIGTPQYMSPEQANGDNANLDHKSDQYSMGLILYELVSLRQAVTGKSAMKIVMRQQDGDKEPLQHAFGDPIPRELRAIVEKATTKDKTKRYEHILAMAEDIRRYLRDEPVLAKPDTFVQSTGRWVRRHTALTAFAVLTVLFLLVLGVIGIGAGAAIYNFQQSARTTKISGLSSAVFAQASRIDGQFIKYEGLLGTMSATASEKLTLRGEGAVTPYRLADFDGKTDREVPGMRKSSRYGYDVNLLHPVFLVADGAEPEPAEREIGQLAGIGGNLRTVLLRSESEQAARFTPARYQRRIAEQGTPLTWAFIGLESGAFVLYPGRAGIEGFDGREQPWYQESKKVAQREPGPRWSVPFPDFHGQGFVLTVSQPIFDANDALLGVAGVSLTFDYIIDALMQPPDGLRGVREVVILNKDGERIIGSDDKGKKPAGGRSRAKATSAYDVPEVVNAIKGYERAGVVSTRRNGETQLVVFNRMESLGWYLVLAGNESEMLGSDI